MVKCNSPFTAYLHFYHCTSLEETPNHPDWHTFIFMRANSYYIFLIHLLFSCNTGLFYTMSFCLKLLSLSARDCSSYFTKYKSSKEKTAIHHLPFCIYIQAFVFEHSNFYYQMAFQVNNPSIVHWIPSLFLPRGCCSSDFFFSLFNYQIFLISWIISKIPVILLTS